MKNKVLFTTLLIGLCLVFSLFFSVRRVNATPEPLTCNNGLCTWGGYEVSTPPTEDELRICSDSDNPGRMHKVFRAADITGLDKTVGCCCCNRLPRFDESACDKPETASSTQYTFDAAETGPTPSTQSTFDATVTEPTPFEDSLQVP